MKFNYKNQTYTLSNPSGNGIFRLTLGGEKHFIYQIEDQYFSSFGHLKICKDSVVEVAKVLIDNFILKSS